MKISKIPLSLLFFSPLDFEKFQFPQISLSSKIQSPTPSQREGAAMLLDSLDLNGRNGGKPCAVNDLAVKIEETDCRIIPHILYSPRTEMSRIIVGSNDICCCLSHLLL